MFTPIQQTPAHPNKRKVDIFVDRITDACYRTDQDLYKHLISLLNCTSGRETVRNIRKSVFGAISDKCIAAIRDINPSGIRHYTGIINVSFRSTLTPEELDFGLHDRYDDEDACEDEFDPRFPPDAKVKMHLHSFSLLYWQAAARQASASPGLCKLIFGLSDEVVQILASAHLVDIKKFAKHYPQRFSLSYGELFFCDLKTIPDAADNPKVSFLKSLFAIQSPGCFKLNPEHYPPSESISPFDVAQAAPERAPVTAPPELTWIYRQQGKLSDYGNVNKHYRIDQNRKSWDIHDNSSQTIPCSQNEFKKLLIPELYLRGLTNNQLASFACMTEAKVRAMTGPLEIVNDGRANKRKRDKKANYMRDPADNRKATREDLVCDLMKSFFINLYLTLGDENAIKQIDIKAFFTSEHIIKENVFKKRLGLEPASLTTSELFDTILKLLQGQYRAQRCPSCGFVFFFPIDNGKYETNDENQSHGCTINRLFSGDESLYGFGLHLKNLSQYIPDEDEPDRKQKRCSCMS